MASSVAITTIARAPRLLMRRSATATPVTGRASMTHVMTATTKPVQ